MQTPTSDSNMKTFLYRRGLLILVALIVLELFDYFMAQWSNGSITILAVLALINAVLIIQYYMHVHTLFDLEGDHS